MKKILSLVFDFFIAFGLVVVFIFSVGFGTYYGHRLYDEYKNEIPNTEKTDIMPLLVVLLAVQKNTGKLAIIKCLILMINNISCCLIQ